MRSTMLVVVAEAAAEDVDAARMLGIGLHPDAQPDRVVVGHVEICKRYLRDLHPVDIGAVLGHAPGLEFAVLAAAQRPPVGRIDAALDAELARAGPGAQVLLIHR